MPRVTPPSTIAIDGPGAVGKSSVGKRLARRLGYLFVDTGAMYRALTWLALERHIDVQDHRALGELADQCTIELSQRIHDPEEPTTVRINGRDVTKAIRSPEVDKSVSLVAQMPAVRRVLVARQQKLARQGPVVMVGRDIGTVVLPDAHLKIYLTASAEERAKRRFKEVSNGGQPPNFAEVLQDLKMRDKLDSERALSPLRPARDAIMVDTDNLNLEQVVDNIHSILLSRSRERKK